MKHRSRHHGPVRSGLCLAIAVALAPTAWAQQAAGQSVSEETQDPQSTSLDTISVRGEYIPEPVQNTAEVANFVTAEDFKRSGDGDAAQALARVSGLSLVGGKYVYVRGLGERYSSALFNGSPLPSPEPMQRVVPLDLFPSEALSGVTVQKTYSARYSGEFGGGVIDLQGLTVPEAPFAKLSFGIGGNSATTGEKGLTHYGGDRDWWGYDDGTRDLPGSILHSGALVNSGNFTTQELRDMGAALNDANLYLLQQNNDIDPDFNFGGSAGTGFDLGEGLRLGLVGVLNVENEWRTRFGKQQYGTFADSGLEIYEDYDFVTTRNNARVNGMFGAGLQGERHSVAWNTLYVHDTVKETKSRSGYDFNAGDGVRDDGTLWLERELVNNQLSGKSSFGEYDDVKIEWRVARADATRKTPYETGIRYHLDGTGTWTYPRSSSNYFKFGAVDDEVTSAGVDLGWRLPTERELTLSAGIAWSDNDRSAVQRSFEYYATGPLPTFNQYQRIDYLFSDYNLQNDILTLRETTPNNNGESYYKAKLKTRAAYAQIEGEIAPLWRAALGLRFEDATQSVTPLDLFSGERAAGSEAIVPLENDYLLPALTLTWNFADNQQLRFGASKTIARPQFRELAPQQYTDPDNDRLYFGNPYLVDSELVNFDLRYEWFYGLGEYFTAGLFHKTIDRPVEAIVGVAGGNTLVQTFINAPEATLYGIELDFKKYFDGIAWGGNRLYFASNYTWSKSEVNASAGDAIKDFLGNTQPATYFVRDGSQMQGQSEHIANLQLGIESQDGDLQATLIANYVSERISVRGDSGQPDYMEDPGTSLDFVLRKGLEVGWWKWGKPSLKFSARNLLDTRHKEYQERGGERVDLYTYEPGISWDVSLTLDF